MSNIVLMKDFRLKHNLKLYENSDLMEFMVGLDDDPSLILELYEIEKFDEYRKSNSNK